MLISNDDIKSKSKKLVNILQQKSPEISEGRNNVEIEEVGQYPPKRVKSDGICEGRNNDDRWKLVNILQRNQMEYVKVETINLKYCRQSSV
ncbi:hypothetical protein CEXT_690911 [Caerostris extrusa]|uniref:Uncharacterized protein n=1 Tax=Caerostris extrusa TaxID=172846 RepID=A0AAV4YAW0_CAEEX|nr:hypothetical protein CEXT_690911 [Caerostris extrusa]